MIRAVLLAVLVGGAVMVGAAQSIDRALLHRPLADAWPTYSGDYSGKRYSALTQLNRQNVRNLTMAWTRRHARPHPASATSAAA